jgi:glyoxylase-like metal-dependent hydrolase (beta-lactamase superfamily II)
MVAAPHELVRVARSIAFLATALAAGVAAIPAASESPPKPYDLVTLAPDVYGFVWKDPLQEPIEGNALFVINDRDVLVVDTGIFPSTARRMAAEVKKLTNKPVRYVVNTHWHDDHHNGNMVYREMWPGVEFVAHANTRADLIVGTYEARPKDLADMQQNAAKYERWAKEGKDDDGKPLEERRRKRAAELAEVFRTGYSEFSQVKDTPPDLTFTDGIVLHRGERTIDIRCLGRGNTRGDLVVLLPKERIVATGDLLVAPVPFGIGSYYADWITTLGKLDALPVDVLFPGHGPVQRDRVYLHQVQGLLKDLVMQVSAAVDSGKTLEDTQQRVTLSEWRATLTGEDKRKQLLFDSSFLSPAVERAWYQAKGEVQWTP